jgi:hypothetical protein
VDLYVNQKIALATCHHKEKMIARPVRIGLGAAILVPPKLNTDALGTFTGEIPRPGTMDETAVRKARLGMETLGICYGIASEGSFGPHPFFPFGGYSNEILVFVDDDNKLVVFERMNTSKTNYAFYETGTHHDLDMFLKSVGFPRHAVIVKPKYPKMEGMVYKGISDYLELNKVMRHCQTMCSEQQALIQTDMRAMMNPTRQKVIRQLAFKLVRRLQQTCVMCAMPGWGQIDVEIGLPCRLCSEPTEQIQYYIQGCSQCGHSIKEHNSRSPVAEPQYCHYCNP